MPDITLSMIVQVALSLLLPIGVLLLARRSKTIRTLSPVVVSYVLGMALGSQHLVPFNSDIAMPICGFVVALAIPMLLFSVDFIAWARLAGTTILSFFLACVAALAAAAIAHFIFRGRLADTPMIAGMLSAVYIGSTANLNAVGYMLGVTPQTLVMVNTADMLLSILYLMFLMTVAGRVIGLFLRPFPYPEGKGPIADGESWNETGGDKWPGVVALAPGIALSLAIVAVGAGTGTFVSKNSRDMVSILVITTLGILASFVPKVRALQGTQIFGLYMFLIFFFGIGITADLSLLFRSSPMVFLFTLVVIFGTVVIHLILAMIFRIDRDTMIITSTATVFSPPFVPSVAMALRNKEMLVSGIMSGLVGYAVANYAGVILAWILR